MCALTKASSLLLALFTLVFISLCIVQALRPSKGASTNGEVAAAYCECGYSVNRTSDASFEVFTDLFENDFLHAANPTDERWTPQQYNVTPKLARGPYGKEFRLANVVSNPLRDPFSWAGASVNGGDAGLQLWVRKDADGLIPAAEIAAQRTDILYGSFRVGMKMSKVNGTCGAFFWFRNDSQEIDMEFLSKQFRPSAGSVNLVLQTPDSVRAGYDASGTPAYAVPLLPFAPDAQFHEYRFDWSPDKISFYADGHWLADMTVFSPNAPGHLVLNHWSNGDAAWSAGPPESDAVMTIAYIKAYFNSSDPARQAEYAARCASPNARSVCHIPDQRTPPDPAGPQGNQTAKTYFFSQDPGHVPLGADGNATKGKTGDAVGLCEDGWSVAFVAALPFLATLLLNLVMTV